MVFVRLASAVGTRLAELSHRIVVGFAKHVVSMHYDEHVIQSEKWLNNSFFFINIFFSINTMCQRYLIFFAQLGITNYFAYMRLFQYYHCGFFLYSVAILASASNQSSVGQQIDKNYFQCVKTLKKIRLYIALRF